MRGGRRDTRRNEMTSNSRQYERALPTLEPLPDYGADTETCTSTIGTRPRRAQQTSATSSTQKRRGRLPRIAAIVIAATILGAAVTHRYDQSSGPVTPHWIQACQAAIDATARLRQQHGIELDEAMQSTWALVAGVHVQPQPIDTSSIARLQRDADNKTRDCVTPTDPAQSR